jgi:hypothetical protein
MEREQISEQAADRMAQEVNERSVIARGLRIASDLPTGVEPTDSARAVIVDLCTRLHRRIVEASIEPRSHRVEGAFFHAALGFLVGLVIGVGIAAYYFNTAP